MPPRPQDNNYDRIRPFVEHLERMRPSAGLDIPIDTMVMNIFYLRVGQIDDEILEIISMNNNLLVNYQLCFNNTFINVSLARSNGMRTYKAFFTMFTPQSDDLEYLLCHCPHEPRVLPYLNESNEIIITDEVSKVIATDNNGSHLLDPKIKNTQIMGVNVFF